MAEGKGFEPPKGISSFNDLANRRLQPLGHPSAGVTYGCPHMLSSYTAYAGPFLPPKPITVKPEICGFVIVVFARRALAHHLENLAITKTKTINYSAHSAAW